jgi:adenine-specific DNA-methyltransferase
MSELDDLMPSSPDHNAARLAQLKRLFPDLFTDEGRLDVKAVRKLADPDMLDMEKYRFTWYGKARARRKAFAPSKGALLYDTERSVNPELAAGNMIIEGENLEVLKLLTAAYSEKVKCIYIDPPYNTGNDFIYPDNYAQGKKEYWEQNGIFEDGVKMDSNAESNGRFHSDWLSMMFSRLLVARLLLKKDGVIFISIDDNEVHNLRKLMDEVFGEENFGGAFVVRSTPNARNYGHIAQMHDYCLMYCKDIEKTKTYELEEKDKEFKYADLNGGFNIHPLYNSDESFHIGNRKNLYYPFYLDPNSKNNDGFYDISITKTDKHTEEVYPPLSTKNRVQFVWRWAKDKSQKHINKEIIGYRNESGEYRIVRKMRHTTKIIRSMLLDKEFSGRRGTAEVESLFDEKVFSFPKPIHLLKTLALMATNEGDLILDFFAGSGVTAQAIIELNKEEHKNRKFVLVQLPEKIDDNERAYKKGFKKISDIAIERTKRVIEGHGETPSLFGAGHKTGFKVYRLAQSRFPRVTFQPDPDKSMAENVAALKQYIAEKEASMLISFDRDAVFDEILLKQGFPLTYTLEQQSIFTSNAVFLARSDERETLICLDYSLHDDTVAYFKTERDPFFICLERALNTDKKWALKHYLGERLKMI